MTSPRPLPPVLEVIKRLEDGIRQSRVESAAVVSDGNAHKGFFIKDVDIGSATLMHGFKCIF